MKIFSLIVSWIFLSYVYLIGVMFTSFNFLYNKFVSLLRDFVSGRKLPKLHELEVLYKSNNFIVVNKNYDIVINSNETKPIVTVSKQLTANFPSLVDNSVCFGFRFVHRLDFATSGALCVALTKKAAANGGNAFYKKQALKLYLALVWGHVKDDVLKIDKPIGKDGSQPEALKMCTIDKKHCEEARDALTYLVTLQRGFYGKHPATKLLVKPVTGRRHQIRVHCDYTGHRIIGDYAYSNRTDVLPYRMMLHSYKLFIPLEEETIDVTAKDCFTTANPILKWTPIETIHNIDEAISLFNTHI